MLTSVDAVLFDIDGTLLNTFDFIYGAFEHAFEVHAIDALSRRDISQLMGGPLEEVYGTMAPKHDPAALAETHRNFQTNNLHLASLFPATLEVLEELKNRKLKIGAITTRSLRTSIRSLETTGIAHFFDVVISAEDVVRHKPDPEPILKGLAAMGISTADAVMVGDTAADILAGKNSGTRTVAALYGFGGESLLDLKPDYAIRDLKEFLLL